MTEAEDDKKKRRTRRSRTLSPYYGAGNGRSAATIPAFRSQGSSPTQGPAFPGAGGTNSPGIAGGPNLGMGPISASFDPLGMAEFEQILQELAVQTPAPARRRP